MAAEAVGLFDDIALGSLERLGRGLGKGATLRALLPLLDSLPPGPGRAKAVARAVELAAELGEDAALARLCARWDLEEGARHADARRLVRTLLNASLAHAAQVFAEAELARVRGTYEEASALYGAARALEAQQRLFEALERYEDAALVGHDQPRLSRATGARVVRVLRALGRTADAAKRAAELLPLEDAPAMDRLAVAASALDVPGRYRRAAALDVLENVAAGGGEAARLAIAIAARHVERTGGGISEIEADRAEAVLAHHPDPVGRPIAIERLRALSRAALDREAATGAAALTDPDSEALLLRVRAVRDGSAPGPRPEAGRAELGWLALEIVHLVVDEHGGDARRLLVEATELVRTKRRVEAPLWTAALASLRARLPEARGLLDALLDADGEPPPRGYLFVADTLEASGAIDESIRARRRAAALREPGARAGLAERVRQLGWEAAKAGQRSEAIAPLREARELAI